MFRCNKADAHRLALRPHAEVELWAPAWNLSVDPGLMAEVVPRVNPQPPHLYPQPSTVIVRTADGLE